MQDTITDRDRIRAAGRPVTLADGKELAVRFGLAELCDLEAAFGSLDAFARGVNRPVDSDGNPLLDDSGDPVPWPIISTTRRALAIGLARHGITYEQLADLFDVARRWEYRDALIAAYNEALAPADPEGKDSAGTSSSRGPTSTTQAPSASADPTTTSGA